MSGLPPPHKSATANGRTSAGANVFMDDQTAAYVAQYDLTHLLEGIDTVVRAVDTDLAPAPPAAELMTSPLSERDDAFPVTSNKDAAEKNKRSKLDATLMLQLLLSSFAPLALTNATLASTAKASGGRQANTPSPTPAPDVSRESTVHDVADSNQKKVSTSSVVRALPWPADATFSSKEAAVRAEICRCIAQHCERLHSGLGLVDFYGSDICWSRVCPAAGGHERLGVALVLDIFRCWRHVAVPLLLSTGDISGGAEALFEALVEPTAQADVRAVCAYWCFTLLQGYCRDVPDSLWASIMRAAQSAAAAQRVMHKDVTSVASAKTSDFAVDDSTDLRLPPVTCEALLLRSFLAHLACPIIERACEPSSVQASTIVQGADRSAHDTVCEDAICGYLHAAAEAARARCLAWVWAEVASLQQALSPEGQACNDASHDPVEMVSALLLSDSYWAVFCQPYTAMFAEYCL